MQCIQLEADINAYLGASAIIDHEHAAIREKAAWLRRLSGSHETLVRKSFEFVRDHIAHSWDVQRGPVTCRASEVLAHEHGYCYAKSHLLAALLRANGIATGFCYQRLAVGDHGAPYCLHGLNAVRLPGLGWFRIDARGNKPGVAAAFTPPVERLAFHLQDAGERDFPQVFAQPLQLIVEALEGAADIFSLHAQLPDAERLEPEL